MIRQYAVFLASSLQHGEEREFFNKTLLEGNTPEVQFFPTLHEKNGVTSIIPGVTSQYRINLKALVCNAFVLYVRDNIGEHTLNEFKNQIANRDRTNHFIFVIHHPGKKIEPRGGNKLYTWDEFYRNFMADQPGGVTYYEIQAGNGDETGMEALKEKIHQIRQEMLSHVMVPLSPADMDYRRLLSPAQEEYRLDFNYYYHRKIDDELAAKINNATSGLTIVSGPSLAGKTRSVVNALRKADDTVRIHFLRGTDSEARDNFMKISEASQFLPGMRNILVIDDIDQLLLSHDKTAEASGVTTKKFNEICALARQDPGHLSVIGTSCVSADNLLAPLCLSLNNPSNLSDYDSIEIKPMKLKEMYEIARILRGRGLLSTDKVEAIRDGMPLGMLFVDLSGLRSRYKALVTNPRDGGDNKSLFGAMKTISIWKRTNRYDFDLLYDFIGKTIDDGWFTNKKQLHDALTRLTPFVTAQARSRTSFSYNVEDIVMDSVIRFETQETVTPSAGDLIAAGKNIIRYIRENLSQQKFQSFSKLCIRVLMLPNGQQAFMELVSEIERLYPTDLILDGHELVATTSGGDKDWVDEWISVLAKRNTIGEKSHLTEELYRKRPSHAILATLLKEEREESLRVLGQKEQEGGNEDPEGDNGEDSGLSSDGQSLMTAASGGVWSSRLFDSSGNLRPEFATTNRPALIEEIVMRMSLEKALGWFSRYDFDSATRAWLITEIDAEDTGRKTVTLARTFFRNILPKISSIEEFELCMSTLGDCNRRRVEAGLPPFYQTDAQKYLHFIPAGAWKEIGQAVPSARVIEIFDILHKVTIQEEVDGPSDVTPGKLMIALNSLVKPMDRFDAAACWEKMGQMRDSYTLRIVMDKMTDFADAKGFFDSFMSSETGRQIKATDIVLNTLLKKVKLRSDLYDCEDSFRCHGLLGKGERISDINDPYITGLLYDRPFLDFKELWSLARRHKEMGFNRTARTNGVIMSHAPDYTTARDLLFRVEGETVTQTVDSGILTGDELEALRNSPMVVSWIFSKVANRKEGDDARCLLRGLIDRWEQEGVADDYFNDSEGHLMTNLIKNRHIFPTLTDINGFIAILSGRGIRFRMTTYLDRHLVERVLHMKGYPLQDRIKEANDLVIRTSDKARKAVWRATDLRFSLGDNNFHKYFNLMQVEPYPCVDEDGNWRTGPVTTRDFFMNILAHRYAHPKTMQRVLTAYGRILNGHGNKMTADEAKEDVRKIISLALNNKTFINGKAYLGLRAKFLPHGIDLEPICSDYSIMADVCTKLTSNRMTAEEAEKKIKEYEKRKNIRIHRSQVYYDAVISSLPFDPEQASIDSILKHIRNLPDHIIFSEQMFRASVRCVRNLDDLKKLENAYDGVKSANRYIGIITAIKGIKDTTSHKVIYRAISNERDQQEILNYVLGYDGTGALNPPEGMDDTEITAMLSLTHNISFGQCMDFIEANGYTMMETTLFNFIYRCQTADDWRRLEPFLPDGKLNANLLNALLNRIYDFDRKIFRDSLSDYFAGDEATVTQWAMLIQNSEMSDHEKLHSKLSRLSNLRVSPADTPSLRELPRLARAILSAIR